MNKWISFFSEKKILSIVLIVVYYLIVVLPHEEVGKFIAGAFSDMSRDAYNKIILLCTLAGLLLYLIPVIRNMVYYKSKRLLIYLLINVLLAVLCFKVLFVVNVEAIHFIQYGFLALLIFPLVKSYWKTAVWCMILGSIDEGWQYFYLAPLRTNYYDFNDVIINTVGAGFGLIFIRSFYPELQKLAQNLFSSIEFYLLLIFTVTTVVLYQTGHLIRKPMEGFWQKVHPQVTYHVVFPMEGLIIILMLLLLYRSLKD